jgi:hypothetical protein
MRYRLMATYRGVPYEAGLGPAGSDVVLFAACPPPEELGFEPATGHWRKRVIRAEVDALWESRPVGNFRDEPCIVLDDLGDRLHIAYLGADADRAASLGYWQVDRGVFELLAPREEVTGLVEERVDKPLLASQPVTAAALDSTYPYHPASLAERLGPPPERPAPPDDLPSLPHLPPANDLPSLDHLPPASDLPSLDHLPPASDLPSLDHLPPADYRERPDHPGPAHLPSDYLSGAPDYLTAVADTPAPAPAYPDAGGRAGRRQRVPTRDIFCELADLAAIPRTAYALETEVEGAMCLVPAAGGFEVFVAIDGARHEARFFSDEEAAYFYLFGVLVAEAVRNGALEPSVAPVGDLQDLS